MLILYLLKMSAAKQWELAEMLMSQASRFSLAPCRLIPNCFPFTRMQCTFSAVYVMRHFVSYVVRLCREEGRVWDTAIGDICLLCFGAEMRRLSYQIMGITFIVI